jgi:hypothetical protein
MEVGHITVHRHDLLRHENHCIGSNRRLQFYDRLPTTPYLIFLIRLISSGRCRDLRTTALDRRRDPGPHKILERAILRLQESDPKGEGQYETLSNK